jgi:hypothetical protein
MKKLYVIAGLWFLMGAAALAQSPEQTGSAAATATPAQSVTQPQTLPATEPASQTAAQPTTLAGTWKGSFDFNGSAMPITLHLTAATDGVTGTVEGLPTTPAVIHDGKIAGDALTFWVDTDYQGTTYKLIYTGKISPGQIVFTFGTDDGSWSARLTVTRMPEQEPAAPDLTGAWKGAFDFNGDSVPLTFHFTSAAGAVTGTVEGLPTTPAQIHDGKIDGDTLTFWLTTDYQGQPYKLLYKGKIAAGQIVFKFGTEDGSWGTNLTATRSL